MCENRTICTMQLRTSTMEATGSLQIQLQQAIVVLCCLDSERVAGSDDNTFLVSCGQHNM